MKKTFKITAILLIPIIIMFLLFAFAQWEINPSIWEKDTRAFFAFITLVLLCFSGIITAALKSENKL